MVKSSGGGDFLTKLTSYLAVGFVFLALSLTYGYIGVKSKVMKDSGLSGESVDKLLGESLSKDQKPSISSKSPASSSGHKNDSVVKKKN